MDETINVIPAQLGFYVVNNVAWELYPRERAVTLEAKHIGVPVVAWLVISSVKHGAHSTRAEPLTFDECLRLDFTEARIGMNAGAREIISPDDCVCDVDGTRWFSVYDFVMERWLDAQEAKRDAQNEK